MFQSDCVWKWGISKLPFEWRRAKIMTIKFGDTLFSYEPMLGQRTGLWGKPTGNPWQQLGYVKMGRLPLGKLSLNTRESDEKPLNSTGGLVGEMRLRMKSPWKLIGSRSWLAKLVHSRVKQSNWLKNSITHEDGNSWGSERGWSNTVSAIRNPQTKKLKNKGWLHCGSNIAALHGGWRARPMLFCPLAPPHFCIEIQGRRNNTINRMDGNASKHSNTVNRITPRTGDLPSPLLLSTGQVGWMSNGSKAILNW